MSLHELYQLNDLGAFATVQEELAVPNLVHHGILVRLFFAVEVFEDFNLHSFFGECIVAHIYFKIGRKVLNLIKAVS